jgi:hypothetical protein
MQIEFWSENLKETYHLGDIGVDGNIIASQTNAHSENQTVGQSDNQSLKQTNSWTIS